MDLTPETVGAALSEQLTLAVAYSGLVGPEDTQLACAIMHEELKALLSCGLKYANERYLIMTGEDRQAWASLVAEVLRRIKAEKNGPDERPTQEAVAARGLQLLET